MDTVIIEQAFSFLKSEYWFTFEGIKPIAYLGYVLPYRKNNYGIVVEYELPDILYTTTVNILNIKFDDWWGWQPKTAGISKYIETILDEKGNIAYKDLQPELLTIYKKLDRHGLTKIQGNELGDRLLEINVQTVRIYLDYYWPEV